MSSLAVSAGADKRLSEQEQKLVVTLLSDPTYFPIEFKSWLKLFIENSDIRINANQVYGGGGTGAGAPVGLPAGIILGIPSDKYPADCIPADGRVLLRAEYTKLFDAIGVRWGAGDGTTNFNIPDCRDRALYGAGSRVGLALTDGLALGSRGGPDHHHTVGGSTSADGSHGHNVSVNVSGSYSGSTNSPGHHSHSSVNEAYAQTGGQTFMPAGGGSTSRYLVTNYSYQTGLGGDHSHSCSGSFSGSGSGSADSQGSHQHSLSLTSSGGYGLTPSFAGVLWVITTGK